MQLDSRLRAFKRVLLFNFDQFFFLLEQRFVVQKPRDHNQLPTLSALSTPRVDAGTWTGLVMDSFTFANIKWVWKRLFYTGSSKQICKLNLSESLEHVTN